MYGIEAFSIERCELREGTTAVVHLHHIAECYEQLHFPIFQDRRQIGRCVSRSCKAYSKKLAV